MAKGWKLESIRHSLAAKGVETGRNHKYPPIERTGAIIKGDVVYATPQQLAEYYSEAAPKIHTKDTLENFYAENTLATAMAIQKFGRSPYKVGRTDNSVTLELKDEGNAEAEYIYMQKKYPNIKFALRGKTVIAKDG